MKLIKSLLFLFVIIQSQGLYAQDYKFATLKPGVKNDLESLISNSNNFSRETDHVFGGSILYLKYTNNIANIFKKYGSTSASKHDSRYITSLNDLISVGESFDTYFQCVQFIRALSDAEHTSHWRWSGAKLNSSMYLKWRVIAKFKSNGKYWQPGDSKPYGHVAIAIGSNSNGVYVIDQNWEGNGTADYGKVSVHLLPWHEAENYSLLTVPKT
ncbi:hypothetical protein BGP78_01400 [Pseudoalteromonas sp. MSK9-3]|uniref:BPSL0067 family protein n=1 Tax=Pseudoalteromonas sp. MSK9-3 TaxID=1897633 RepID=UPI000E6C9E79|nr:BPSL0067 family protein [Pseudoalteromonas sp. MSK9-3]RJE77680.1 hypothetical protein BGP78_01400 [Pseudoalteromonas sp. MSK9-3]